MQQKPNFWFYASISLAIVLVVSIMTGGFSSFVKNFQTNKIASKVLEFVKASIPPGQEVELTEASYKDGLYEISFKVREQPFTVYVGMAGDLLFPQAIDLTQRQGPQPSQDIPKKESAEALLFTMSYCPYGNQAEEVMAPVVELLGDKAQIEPHYVIYENYGGGGPDYCLASGKYCSLHGIDELNQDIRELCVFKYQKEKYWDFVGAINAECKLENIEQCWEKVAQKQAVDVSQVKSCYDKEALELLKTEAGLNQKYGVTGSPTLLINEVAYQGSRTPEAYKEAICSGFNQPPAECEKALESESSSSQASSGACK